MSGIGIVELLNFEVLAYLDETRKSNPNNDTQKVRQEAVKSKGSRPCPYVQLPVSIPAVGPSRRQNNTRNRGRKPMYFHCQSTVV